MASTGQSGYVFKDSGTTPPIDTGQTINWNRESTKTPKKHHDFSAGDESAVFSTPQETTPTSQVNESNISTPRHDDVAASKSQNPQNLQSSNKSPYEQGVSGIIGSLGGTGSKDLEDVNQEFGSSESADSHDLARREQRLKGEAQKQPIDATGDPRDLGWHKNLDSMPDTLIGGIKNENVLALIRRFNKDVFDVRSVPKNNLTGLDLTEAWDDEHAADKLTLNLQRAYLSIILGLTSFMKHISRLRSWKETKRTLVFCIVYFIAWAFDSLMPLVLGVLLVVIGSERARNVLFPPVPLSLVNLDSGGIQNPPAGQLGTTDTITGAPEKAAGEAREEEATNFVDNMRHILARAAGMHGNQDSEGEPLEGKVPKPISHVLKEVRAAGSAPGHVTDDPEQTQTQQPMEEILWGRLKPKVIEPVFKMIPHVLGEIVDNWERVANSISPKPPFSRISFLRIEAVILCLLLSSLVISQYMMYKATGFAIGFSLFGRPIILRCQTWLDDCFPQWKRILEPKHNILRGVPTNNQLALTLLRIGEKHGSPIPPFSRMNSLDSNIDPNIQADRVPLTASTAQVKQAIEPSDMPEGHGDQPSSSNNDNDKHTENKEQKHQHLSKVLTTIKAHTRTIVETKLAIDHIRAKAGSHKVRDRLGVLPKQEDLIFAGPAEFKARFDGRQGWLYIKSSETSSTSTPEHRLLFTTQDPRNNHSQIDESDKSKTLLAIQVRDIHRLKRAPAFANKPIEKAADWSADAELLASLEIDDESGKTLRFTAIPERDELFNRLIAVGGQKWENL